MIVYISGKFRSWNSFISKNKIKIRNCGGLMETEIKIVSCYIERKVKDFESPFFFPNNGNAV